MQAMDPNILKALLEMTTAIIQLATAIVLLKSSKKS